MSKWIVSDASPLITFARAQRLEFLRQVVGRLLVPEAVHNEVVVKGAGKPGAAEVQGAGWIASRALTDRKRTSDLPGSLGQGEKEAIALCQELGVYLLVDDPAARREARAKGIALISTLDVLDEGKGQKLIPDVKPTLHHLIRTGFRLKRTLYETKLRAAGEHP